MSDKMKDVALSSQQAEQRVIPFGKAVRVGNYKLWRSKKAVGMRSSKFDLEQINVSTLDGDWQVKIPSTVSMYSLVFGLFSSGDDARLSSVFGNMYYASIVGNGYFHQALTLCATIFANPNLLNEDDPQHEILINNVRALSSGFLKWREGYDASLPPDSDESLLQDGHVEQAIAILSGEGEKKQ